MEEVANADVEFAKDLLAWMEKEFGWKEHGLFTEENDWMLIIKLHAIIETCLNGAIIRELEKPSLSDAIGRLETSNPKTGKAALAKSLGIIEKDSFVFIQKLSELRNLCVHDIKNFKFRISDYFDKIPDVKRNEFVKAFQKLTLPEYSTNPTQALLLTGTFMIVTEFMGHELKCHARSLTAELTRLKAERWDAHNQSTPKE